MSINDLETQPATSPVASPSCQPPPAKTRNQKLWRPLARNGLSARVTRNAGACQTACTKPNASDLPIRPRHIPDFRASHTSPKAPEPTANPPSTHPSYPSTMANPLDTDAGSELFSSYEAEFKLVQADLTQKLDQIPELSGEPRKAAISSAERALEEADELLGQMRLEKSNIPSAARSKINQRFRNFETSIDQYRRKLTAQASDRAALFGSRYTDNPNGSSAGGDVQLEQRQQLLAGTDRLDRSTQRLRNSQALANETEAIGASTLADLHGQRERILHTGDMLGESEGYVDRSVKTLRGMARR
ncbi:hypothetical protein JX266_000043 [Neoarthrinium moseri]|nr:hypothetical protein JX266_000043 [Neoarthrinium moseri]